MSTSTSTLIERVNSYADLYREMSVDPKNYEPKSNDPADIVGNEMKKLDLVYQYFRDSRVPNWNDTNEWKWIPFYDHKVSDANPSGFRFLSSYRTDSGTDSVLGPLLVVFDETISDHIGKTFIESFRIVKFTQFSHERIVKDYKDYKQIQTLDDAFAAIGMRPDQAPVTTGMHERFKRPIELAFQAMVVGAAIRGDFEPDYNDEDQEKHYPVFDMEDWDQNPSGFRFLCSYDTDTATDSVLGPLLVQPDAERCEYMAKQFEPLFKELLKGK